jgi:N-acetylglutamate synthase-like GNAT family acetyltransferase
LDIRRATREELGEIDALLAASGRPPLPPRVSLANVLVGREADCVIGVVALEVVARRGLTLWAAVAADHAAEKVLTSLMHSLIARAQELGLREIYALTGNSLDLLAPFGFAPISPGTVPKEVRFMPCYPKQSEAASQILRLELETRL